MTPKTKYDSLESTLKSIIASTLTQIPHKTKAMNLVENKESMATVHLKQKSHESRGEQQQESNREEEWEGKR